MCRRNHPLLQNLWIGFTSCLEITQFHRPNGSPPWFPAHPQPHGGRPRPATQDWTAGAPQLQCSIVKSWHQIRHRFGHRMLNLYGSVQNMVVSPAAMGIAPSIFFGKIGPEVRSQYFWCRFFSNYYHHGRATAWAKVNNILEETNRRRRKALFQSLGMLVGWMHCASLPPSDGATWKPLLRRGKVTEIWTPWNMPHQMPRPKYANRWPTKPAFSTGPAWVIALIRLK